MSGGVVYGIGSGTGSSRVGPGLLGKFGDVIEVSGIVPPGWYYIDSTFTITDNDGDTHVCEAGLCNSDGFSVTATGNALPLGAGKTVEWPWSKPWPLNLLS
jgi:hypothetical protein